MEANDLETLRRAVPLWRSDYAFEPIGHQCMTYGISLWIPYHGTGTVACADAGYYGGGRTPVEPYAFWSNAAPSLVSGIDIREREIDYETLRRLVRQWRAINVNYYGDYYPLTAYSRTDDNWIAWQFHRPESDAGLVQAFLRPQCPEASIQLRLRDLRPEASYRFTRLDVPGEFLAKGSTLMDAGLTVTASSAPAAVVLTYQSAGGSE
jgi:alpha-galactosidase